MSTAGFVYLPFTKGKTYCDFTHYTMSQLGAFLKTGALSDLLKGRGKGEHTLDRGIDTERRYLTYPLEDIKLHYKENDIPTFYTFKTIYNKENVFCKGYFELNNYETQIETYNHQLRDLEQRRLNGGMKNNNYIICSHMYFIEILQSLNKFCKVFDHEAKIYKSVSAIHSLKNNVVQFKVLYKETPNKIFDKDQKEEFFEKHLTKLHAKWSKDTELNTRGLFHTGLKSQLQTFINDLYEKNTFKIIVITLITKQLMIDKIQNPKELNYNQRNKDPWTLFEFIEYLKYEIKDQYRFQNFTRTIVLQLLHIIRELEKNEIQHNDMHNQNIFVNKFEEETIFNEMDPDYKFCVKQKMPRLLIFDWDYSYSKPSQNEHILGATSTLCTYYGLCPGINAKLDSYRFVYSILQNISNFCKKKENIISHETSIDYITKLQQAFFIPNSQDVIKTTGNINEGVDRYKNYKYYPCNNHNEKDMKGVNICLPFATDEPKKLKNVSEVLKDIIVIETIVPRPM